MKIAVLTFPLLNNYGGILQAFAMMKMLKNLGHEPMLVNLKLRIDIKFKIKYFIKRYLLCCFKKYRNPVDFAQNKNIKKFIKNNINPKTKKIYNIDELYALFNENNFNACIVGSDQVFALMGIYNFTGIYSLYFLHDNIIRIAYAASFGGDTYRGDKTKIDFYSKNLKKFELISVREKSGVEICNKIFGVEATHVLDPTMMINKNNYIKLFRYIKESKSEGKILAYILDKNGVKDNTIKNISKNKNLCIYEINDGKSTDNTVSIEGWIKAIYDAEIVITDSFHGCVFSIIFNKQFYCFINEERGADRFYSLLDIFNLRNRIIDNSTNFNNNINYNNINKLLLDFIEKSRSILKKSI
ncbi:polysaccharide pyruvyl transferase family protein [Campylobacter geochelonis]|uniref:Putative WfaX n=1 Tax=Campylobacter geochelonis TaxID=1780362 RepID=A0A128EJ16_9BACT|nr:polysaccharide pyruvyl transferase family protein [Campylobacter geochelonis]QKF71220.1 polysaccharide pyruvyl transferase [Campylobacter geochelonis]CZE48860.1 putative WfaX [Campylobacter geochelonis]